MPAAIRILGLSFGLIGILWVSSASASPGQLDRDFADDGRAMAYFRDFNEDYDDADAMAVLPSGKVLVSGTAGDYRMGIIRLEG